MSPPSASIRSHLHLAVLNSSAFATHLIRVLRTYRGLEATLCTVYYTLNLLHTYLTQVLEQRYEKLAASIVSKASETMLPGETFVATIEPPNLALRELCIGVQSSARMINNTRRTLRLGGLLSIYKDARLTYLNSPRDAIVKLLVWGKLGVKTAFQVCENGAFLASQGVLRGKNWEKREARLWLWSNRFWLGYVGVELLRLLRVRQLKFNEELGAESEMDTKAKIGTRSEELERRWWRQLYASGGWIAYCLHWRVADELPTPNDRDTSWLAGAGIVPGAIALQDVWKETV